MGKKIFFIILIFAGVFLRLYRINELPAGLFIDEAAIAVDAKSIAQDGMDEYGRRFPFAFEALSDFRPPGYVYLTAIVFKFLGPTLLTVRFVALLSSIIGIFLLGYFTKLLFPTRKILPYIAMAALSLSPFYIHFSRIGYETTLATTLMLAYFISLLHLFKKPNIFWTIVGTVGIIASFWTYPGPKFILPILTGILFLMGLFKFTFGQNRKNVILYSLFFLGICFIGYIPGLLHPVFDKRPLGYIKEGTNGTVIGVLTTKPKLMLSSWLYMFDFQFLFKKGDLFAYRHGTKEQGLFLEIFVIPFVLGLMGLIRRYSNRSLGIPFLVILTLVIGLPSALTSSTPYGTRILPILIPFSIFIAIGVDMLFNLTDRLNYWLRTGIYALSIGILFFQIFLFSHIYFIHFKTTSLPEFPKAATDMALFVRDYKQTHPKSIIYFLNDRSCRAWSHDDLHLWYFADLDSRQMTKWNNMFRTKRYKHGSPFDAYDREIIPTYSFDNIVLFPGYEKMAKAPAGSLLVKCGIHLLNIKTSNEKIIKVFYLYEHEQREFYYVLSEKL